MELKGCCAIITGASQGFGFAVAKQFLQEGANIFLCARNATLLCKAQKILLAQAQKCSQVFSETADVSNLEQMKKLAEVAIEKFGKIDVLVANAGIYGPKGLTEEVDWDEWSKTIDINLKGTVLQCRVILPHFKKNRAGKIIVLSGGGATKPMPNLSAYATSKAGVVRFAETLAEEVKDFNIDVNTVAPGALNTRLLDEVLEAGPEKVGKLFYEQCRKQKQNGGTPLEIGAAFCVFLASSRSNGITGKLLSAIWDPWEKLPSLIDQLACSDIYTLRRITPKDRGQNWSDM